MFLQRHYHLPTVIWFDFFSFWLTELSSCSHFSVLLALSLSYLLLQICICLPFTTWFLVKKNAQVQLTRIALQEWQVISKELLHDLPFTANFWKQTVENWTAHSVLCFTYLAPVMMPNWCMQSKKKGWNWVLLIPNLLFWLSRKE